MPWTDEILSTDRLSLRAPAEGDRPTVVSLLTDPDVRRFLGGPVDLPADFADHPLGRQPGVWCVERGLDGAAIGTVSINDQHHGAPELSFSFVPDAWGHGFAAESCRAVLAWFWAHDAETDAVLAVTQTANAASLRLLTRLGFEETERRHEFGELQSVQTLRRPD